MDSALGRGGAGDTGLTSPEIPAETALPAGRMRWASRSAPPEPRELSDPTSRSPGGRGLEIHPAPRLRPWPLPGPRPLSPGAPLTSLSPQSLPEDIPWSRYPARPTPRGKRRAGGGARGDSGHLGPPRGEPTSRARPPCGPRPRRPPPWACTTPNPLRARPRSCCSTYLQPLLSSHHSMLGKPGQPRGPPVGGRLLPLSPGPPRPLLGRGASGRLLHRRPPARPAGRTPGPRLRSDPGPRLGPAGRAAAPRARANPALPPAASLLARPQPRPPPLPPPLLLSFASGEEVGEPAPAAGDA